MVAAALSASAATDFDGAFRVRVASYNIRCETEEADVANVWGSRKADLVNLVKSMAPDVIGFQEVRTNQTNQYQYLRDQLPGYAFIGEMRDCVARAEATPVAFLKDRFTPLGSGTFWLSATPTVPGSTNFEDGVASSLPRVCTWVLLQDRTSGGAFCFASTHLDHRQRDSRTRAVELILRRLAGFEAKAVPVVVVGDMNALETEASMVAAAKAMQDSLLVSRTPPTGPWRTLNNFMWKDEEPSCAYALANYSAAARTADKSTLGSRIDYIFTSPGTEVESFAIRNDARPGMRGYPSDHYPIAAELRMPCASKVR